MKYPVKPVRLPKDLNGVENGKVPTKLMHRVFGGYMHKLAAQAFYCMALEAKKANIHLKPSSRGDMYRSYEAQERVFLARYQLRKNKSPITRQWKGKTWYLKSGVAPVAVPGTSNHGWGLAIDIAGASGPTLEWLLQNAHKYGFTWEVADGPGAEAWHIRYVSGDRIPFRVRRILKKHPMPKEVL